MMTYTEAKSYLIAKGLKTKEEYSIWWLTNKEENDRIGLPQFPEEYYKEDLTKNKHN
jgi:beta-lactam-binding protein with PASTA domain